MNNVVNWVQQQCKLKSRGETLWFLLLSTAGWVYFAHQYIEGTGLSEAIPIYAGY